MKTDMPEGWKRLESRIKQGYENHSSDPDLAFLVARAKEMAEALSLLTAPTPYFEKDLNRAEWARRIEQAQSSIEKFRSWK